VFVLFPKFAFGDDAEVTDDVAATDSSTVEGGSDPETTPEDAAKLEDSAQELSQKLEQLKALLDAKGDTADPDLKERLAGLQSQLGALGIGDLGANLGAALPQTKEVQEFLTSCVAMSMKRIGSQKASVLNALRLLAKDKLKPEDAAMMDIWRMTATCINELTEQELQQFKNGKLSQLPKTYVEMSKKPEAEKQCRELDDGIWKELKVIATALVGDQEEPKPPVIFGLMAGIPVVLVVGFLAKKFFDMQAEKDAKKDKKKREGKKSK